MDKAFVVYCESVRETDGCN